MKSRSLSSLVLVINVLLSTLYKLGNHSTPTCVSGRTVADGSSNAVGTARAMEARSRVTEVSQLTTSALGVTETAAAKCAPCELLTDACTVNNLTHNTDS